MEKIEGQLHLGTVFFVQAFMHVVCVVCHKYSGPSLENTTHMGLGLHGLDSDLRYEEDRERNKGTVHIRCRHILTPSCTPYHHFLTLIGLQTLRK